MKTGFVAAALLLATQAHAAPPLRNPEEAALRRHIAVLSSDAYGGRKPGTPGGEKAQAYIAAQFAKAGLKPGAKGGGWYQPVALVSRRPGPTQIVLHARGKAMTLPKGAVVLAGVDPDIRIRGAPIIFAGYGVTDATHIALGGLDAHGAVLIITATPPEGVAPVSGADRRKLFAAVGAIATITVTDRVEAAQSLAAGYEALASDPAPPVMRGAMTAATAAGIVAAGLGDGVMSRDTGAAGAHPVRLNATLDVTGSTIIRPYTAANVIGLLPGTGANGEAVAYTAHWDHLGMCRPADATDRICNGAVDNASGVAVLIEIARAQVRGPRSQRDMLFVATTGEELGLLGAEAFAVDPPRPLPKIVAALNIDTIAITDAGQPAAIIGRGITPSLDRLVDEEAVKLGRRVDSDTEANSLVMRQDGWALGKRGLPSVMIGGSFSDMRVLEGYLGGNYHQPTDDMAHLPPLGGAAEDLVLHVAAGRALADRARYPTPAPKPPAGS